MDALLTFKSQDKLPNAQLDRTERWLDRQVDKRWVGTFTILAATLPVADSTWP